MPRGGHTCWWCSGTATTAEAGSMPGKHPTHSRLALKLARRATCATLASGCSGIHLPLPQFTQNNQQLNKRLQDHVTMNFCAFTSCSGDVVGRGCFLALALAFQPIKKQQLTGARSHQCVTQVISLVYTAAPGVRVGARPRAAPAPSGKTFTSQSHLSWEARARGVPRTEQAALPEVLILPPAPQYPHWVKSRRGCLALGSRGLGSGHPALDRVQGDPVLRASLAPGRAQ